DRDKEGPGIDFFFRLLAREAVALLDTLGEFVAPPGNSIDVGLGQMKPVPARALPKLRPMAFHVAPLHDGPPSSPQAPLRQRIGARLRLESGKVGAIFSSIGLTKHMTVSLQAHDGTLRHSFFR